MAEKIIIADLEMNTKALQDANAQLIQDISKLREEQKALKKETNNLTEATDEQAVRFAENDASIKSMSQAYNTNKKVLAENVTGVQGLNDMLSQNATSVQEAAEANKRLKQIRNQMNVTNETEKAAMDDINKKIDENDQFMKDNVSEREKQTMSVGGYKDAILSASNSTNLFGGQLSSMKGVMSKFAPILGNIKNEAVNTAKGFATGAKTTTEMTGAQKALAIATNITSKSMKLLKLALISTGIGAIVVAIGLLVAALAKSEWFTDKLSKAMAPLRGAFEAIIGIIQELAKNINKITEGVLQDFSDTFTIIKNKFLNGVDQMRKAWEYITFDSEGIEEINSRIADRNEEINAALVRQGDSYDRIKSFLTGSVEKIKEGARIQKEIVELGIQEELNENDLILLRAELNNKIYENKKISEDITVSENERIAAAEEALKLSEQLVEEEQKLLDIKINKKTLENSLNETSRADQGELNDLIAQRTEKETEALKLQTRLTNKLNTIRTSADSERKKVQDEKIKGLNDELALFIAINKIEKKTFADQIIFEQELSDKRLAILEKEFAFGKKSKAKYEEEKLNIEKETLEKQAILSIQNLDYELEQQQALLDNKLLTENISNNQIYQARIAALDVLNTIELDKLQEQLDAKLLTQEEFNLAKLSQENEFLTARKELDDNMQATRDEEQQARDEAAEEKRLIDYENELALAEENYLAQLDLKQQDLERQMAIEIAAAEKIGADITAIEKKYAKLSTDIESQKEKFKLDAAAATFGNLATLVGEHTALGKAAAIAETTINTYQAATAAYKAMAGIPYVGPILGAVAAAAAVASGIASVKKITATEVPKAEKGALFSIGGKRHHSGGTKFYGEDGTAFEAEKGELIGVMNRNAAKMFMDYNDKYRAGGIIQRQNVFATGGIVQRQITDRQIDVNYDIMAEKIAEANKALPNPIVGVKDIISESDSYTKVVEGANI